MELEEHTEFLEAAEEDDDVVAGILICLSRSGMRHPPGPLEPRPTPPTEGLTRPLLPPETRWGVRRTRTRTEEAAAGVAGSRASPTTPLSWSGGGGSGSSGSVCRNSWPAPPGSPKRRGEPSSEEHEEPRRAPLMQETELCRGGERIRAPPARRLSAEPHGDSPVLRASSSATPVAFFSGCASQMKAADVVAVGTTETSRTVAQVAPLRQRWTGSSASTSASVGCRRPGKKKTVAELHTLEESLSQEQEKLQKELEKHKEIYRALLDENMRLKKVESRLASCMVASERTAPYIASEAAPNLEWPRNIVESTLESRTVDEPSTVSVTPEEDICERLQCTSSPVSVPGHVFLFDLNCLPDECI